MTSEESYIKKIAAQLALRPVNVSAAIDLLDAGGSVPFISRYRKEATGSLDEVALTSIRDRLQQLRELDKRRAVIITSIDDQGKLTDELKEKILSAEVMTELEDLYLPYKPKRRTRATVAKEKGLEPLAQLIFAQGDFDIEQEAQKYIDVEKKVETTADALAGARDIIAEWVNENAPAREKIRALYFDKGSFNAKVIKGKEEDGKNYKDYFDFTESVKSIASHRLLAVRRAEKEEILMLKVIVPEQEALTILETQFVSANNDAAQHVRMAIADSFKRLLSYSMETEIRLITKETADKEAIRVFAENLRQLLMASPLGQHAVMAIDPGFRTGCKVVCLDSQGKFLANETIFPTGSEFQIDEAGRTIKMLSQRYQIEFIAIGNGTASRETENFVRKIGLPSTIQIMTVNESGASIYSASDVAREEFPDQDVTVRGAISIGRRLMDPLAELVKIDPKSIGVGQYQHDVDQGLLKQSLDDVVISCVNSVGVELNTASKQLLTYVSGLGPTRAQAIIDHRNTNGAFVSREQLRDVAKLGSKAVEQASGFLRIHGGANPLDSSAVHPETYHIVDKMAADLGCLVSQLLAQEALRQRIKLTDYVTDTIGLPTLTDIMAELAKPGRDPRAVFEVFRFADGIEKPEDLKLGMKLTGLVTNITNFGAFVDIGVHLDGLVHISQMSDKFVRDPNDIVKVSQKVKVTVMEVDLDRKRIALSMKNNPDIHFGCAKSK
ncbi:MAG: RNA-binding transcriptional accessory protein [Candidatus Omnitrophica bacterium]|nr:RNA-binding transcriptional accessory protein [Candidatus Omnitrophota bacterium]